MLSNKILCAGFSPEHESADEDNDIGNCCFYFPLSWSANKERERRENPGKTLPHIIWDYAKIFFPLLRLFPDFMATT